MQFEKHYIKLVVETEYYILSQTVNNYNILVRSKMKLG